LRIPHSPIEKKAFRSRTFRRIIFAACALSLFLASIHSINAKNELRQNLTHEYLNLHLSCGSSRWRSHPQQVNEGKILVETPGKKTGDRPRAIENLIKQLPEVIRIPFEDAVDDVKLEGWEDDWFSSVTYDYEKYGSFAEPRIDFVYNCKCTTEYSCVANDCRGQWFGRRFQEHQT
jgi:hypothetical protein